MAVDFDAAFHGLTGNKPFEWQRRLFDEIVAGHHHSACDIPTGLGKTSIIPIWLIALAAQGERTLAADGMSAVTLPRRLVYVVDRRTVVDQATDVAELILKRLTENKESALGPVRKGLEALAGDLDDPEDLLAISTLRGELADNRKWQADPARPAIIVGTVDMIGSRLLFSGYGVSRRMRPFHAGLLGQDALIVHDEAHLSPAFGALVNGIAHLQRNGGESELRPIRVMELSATQRQDASHVFRLNEEELQDERVTPRLNAPKALAIEDPIASDGLADRLVDRALAREAALEPRTARIVVYVRSPDTARKVSEGIAKKIGDKDGKRVATLTGTIRGHERDKLVEDDLFAGFRAKPGRTAPPETQFLVATSAGEVGIDLDADHMISDLTTLDSMIQRLGRVNRLGESQARIDVIHATDAKKGGEEAARIDATRRALESLPLLADGTRDASPQALRAMLDQLGPAGVEECFSPTPLRPALTAALVEAWSMTSLKEHPGRPEVAPWLRGWVEDEQQTRLLWRRVLPVRLSDDNKMIEGELDEYFEAAPPHLSEILGTYTADVAKLLQDRAKDVLKRAEMDGTDDEVTRAEAANDGATASQLGPLNKNSIAAVVLAANGDFERVLRLGELAETKPDRLRSLLVGRTVVVDARLGGLSQSGHLDSKASSVPTLDSPDSERGWTSTKLDLIGYQPGIERRGEGPRDGWKIVYSRLIDARDEDLDDPSMAWEWRVEARIGAGPGEVAPAAAKENQLLETHLDRVVWWMGDIARRAALSEQEWPVFLTAAAVHDLGKARRNWQAFAGNHGYRLRPQEHPPLAKFKKRATPAMLKIGDKFYRHEFGSLHDAMSDARISGLINTDLRDLALHLIVAHHGEGRPVITAVDEIDPTAAGSVVLARDTALRFARLVKRYGPWGLAWREALFRSADVSASRELNEAGTDRKDGEA